MVFFAKLALPHFVKLSRVQVQKLHSNDAIPNVNELDLVDSQSRQESCWMRQLNGLDKLWKSHDSDVHLDSVVEKLRLNTASRAAVLKALKPITNRSWQVDVTIKVGFFDQPPADLKPPFVGSEDQT